MNLSILSLENRRPYIWLSMALISLMLTSCGDKDASTESTASSAPHEGKAIYDKFCKACHAQGINGAPILGNTVMWAPRAEQGEAVLVEHAKNGFGLMPANLGRNEALTEEAIAKVVNYMLAELK